MKCGVAVNLAGEAQEFIPLEVRCKVHIF